MTVLTGGIASRRHRRQGRGGGAPGAGWTFMFDRYWCSEGRFCVFVRVSVAGGTLGGWERGDSGSAVGQYREISGCTAFCFSCVSYSVACFCFVFFQRKWPLYYRKPNHVACAISRRPGEDHWVHTEADKVNTCIRCRRVKVKFILADVRVQWPVVYSGP